MKYIVIFLLFCFTSQSQTDLVYEKRIEFELEDDYEEESILEFGALGFVVQSMNRKISKTDNVWRYELFNTDLEKVKEKKIKLDNGFWLDEVFIAKDMIYTLFSDKKGNYTILSLNPATLEYDKTMGVVPKKSRITDMAILGDYAFFNAKIKKESLLIAINYKTGKQKFIPLNVKDVNPKKIFVENFQILEDSREVFVFVKVIEARRESDIYVLQLNEEGKKIKEYNLSGRLKENIVSISASRVGEGVYNFTGTYSTKSNALSEGLFFCHVQNRKIDFIKRFSFADLEDFFAYLPERKQEKLAQKKKRKEAKGKELVINYLIADHNVILLDDGSMFLGEAYYPTFRREPQMETVVVNGVSQTRTSYRRVFDGHQYTHAVLGKFDNEGNLLWDKSFEMWPSYKPYYAKRFISIAEREQSSIKMVFANRNRIVSKSVDFEGKVLLNEESEEIETGYTGDKEKYSFSNIDYWYGNYFLAYGQQKIKNKSDKNVKKKRKVYFVNKIKY